MSRGSALGTVAKLAVSLTLVGWLGYRYGGDADFRSTLGRLDLRAFLATEAILAAGLALSALRWKLLLAAADVSIPFGRAFRLYLAGFFFNFFLPTTVGGDVVRGMGVGREVPLSVIGGSILVERILGFGCLLGIGLVASFGLDSLQVARTILLVTAAAYVVGLMVLLRAPLPETERDGKLGRLIGGLGRTARQVREYGCRGRALAGPIALSMVWQLGLVGANAVLSVGLGGVAPGKALLALVPVVQAVAMIPVSFGGLGVREMGYEYFFRVSGLDPAGAVALGLAFLGVSIALALKGGLLYAVWPPREGRG